MFNKFTVHTLDFSPLYLGLSQICSKICPKSFWKFPKIFIYYALHASHYACIMLQLNNIDVKFYCLNVLLEYLRYDNRSVWFYLHFSSFWMVYWSVLNHLTLWCILYVPIALLESINLILAYYAGIICQPIML